MVSMILLTWFLSINHLIERNISCITDLAGRCSTVGGLEAASLCRTRSMPDKKKHYPAQVFCTLSQYIGVVSNFVDRFRKSG
jgi:hypothetical protein